MLRTLYLVVEFADLAIIDLAKGSTPDGRAQLALDVTQAMAQQGFFYVINHGYTSKQVDPGPSLMILSHSYNAL